MTGPPFDFDDVFDDDYLHFYGTRLEEASDADAETVWRLLELAAGVEVLDLACGHGRIANRLAERGARVTGLDASRPRWSRAPVRVLRAHVRRRELRDWLLDAGFASVAFCDGEGEPLTAQGRRMITIATRL